MSSEGSTHSPQPGKVRSSWCRPALADRRGGGKLHDEATKKFAVNDPRNARALSWMTDLLQRYHLRKLTAAGGIAGTRGFFNGKMAMYTGVPNHTVAWLKEQARYARYE